jgi:single-strand DNA-binding protein
VSNNFNAVVRVAKDAEVRTTANGNTVLSFTAASNTGYGDKQQTLWLRVSLWRNNAGNLQPYLTKGAQCFISGELTQREYQANDGTTKTSLELNANILDLVGGKRESEGAQEQRPQQRPAKPVQQQRDNFDYDDMEIPF